MSHRGLKPAQQGGTRLLQTQGFLSHIVIRLEEEAKKDRHQHATMMKFGVQICFAVVLLLTCVYGLNCGPTPENVLESYFFRNSQCDFIWTLIQCDHYPYKRKKLGHRGLQRGDM